MAPTPKKTITLKLAEDYGEVGYFRNKTTREVLDISGRMFRAELKADIDDVAVLASFTFSVFQDPADGFWKYRRSLSSTLVAGLGVSEGSWDQFYSDDAGTTWKKQLRGAFLVESKDTGNF